MLALNRLARPDSALPGLAQEFLGVAAARAVEQLLQACPAHRPTTLHTLPALSRELGIASISIKDESTRLRLGSFKALGGAYAVVRLFLDTLSQRIGRAAGPDDLYSAAARELAASFTVACATDGNHGRSVAAGARFIGCRAVIYVHEGVSQERVQAIARFGAEMHVVDGVYDDAVAQSQRACEAHGWTLVSDTSWRGYERVPMLVMQGYTAMAQEMVRELRQPPTHLFLQAGVGGLAAAVAAHFSIVYGRKCPRIIVVEPERAACLHASVVAGHALAIPAGEPTIMSMLECYEPSLIAWEILSQIAHAFMTVDEQDAMTAMRTLARPQANDPAIIAGESGGAGLAGLLRIAQSPVELATLSLDANAHVVLINTEGATDRQRYEEIVGNPAARLRG